MEQIAHIFPCCRGKVVDGIDIGSLFDVSVLIVVALKRAILFRIRNVLRPYRFACLHLFRSPDYCSRFDRLLKFRWFDTS